MGMKMMNSAMRKEHPIPPLYDEQSRVLILGSFPSVKSREQGFFYGHPQNRFWRVLAEVFNCETPVTVDAKSRFLYSHHLAVWDVIASCDIVGSSDSSIKNVVVNDVSKILETGQIREIFVNGKAAEKLYKKYMKEKTGRDAVYLPSTSPANAGCSFEKLKEEWKKVKCL